MSETYVIFVPVDHESSNVSTFIAPADILLPENDIGNSDICEQRDDNDEANDLVIGEDCVIESQLEHPEVLEDSGSMESDE